MLENKKQTYILAEMAASHEGNFEIAQKIIRTGAEAKADGILFQIIDLESYIVPNDEDYDDVKSFNMDFNQWENLIEEANSLGLDVWANVYDLKSAEFCRGKKIKGFKFHSSNLENLDLIKEIVSQDKDILLSIGGLSSSEIKKLAGTGFPQAHEMVLMYGMQNFPTDPKGINLNFIKELSRELNLDWGYQDHSEPSSFASTYLPVLAISKGASIIEKHITHNRALKGQDYESALNPDEFIQFVKDVKTADKILDKKADEVSEGELQYKKYKTLMKVVAKRDIRKGEEFSRENIGVMRSRSGGIPGRELQNLLGKRSDSDYRKFDLIRKIDSKIAIFITARLKSERLPRKVLKPILGRPMVEHMIERLKRTGISPIVMMTSINPQDDPLIEIAERNNIEYFRGSEDDVLVRLRDCARKFEPDLIINATADDPLKEPILIQKMIEKYERDKYDMCEIKGAPDGCECYALDRKALEKVCEIKDDEDTEIWGPYFRDTGIFKCEVIKVDDEKIKRPHFRVTVDTPEDFEVVSKIFENLSEEKPNFDVYDVCEFLDKNPDLLRINSHIETRKPPKIRIKN